MIGFLVGTVCLIGLVKVLRHGRFGHHHHHAYGGGCGGYGGGGGCGGYDDGPRGGWGGPYRGGGGRDEWRGGWRGGRGGFGPRMFLRGLFERLETTPGQEKEIMAAIDELRAQGRAAKDEAKSARAEVAQAMRGESFDEVALGGATARFETAMNGMRKAGISAFARVHGVLDERQRKQLADLIERGPRPFWS